MQSRRRNHTQGAWWTGQGVHPNVYQYPAFSPHYGQGYYRAATPGQRYPQMYQHNSYYDGLGVYPVGGPYSPNIGKFSGRFTTDRPLPSVTPRSNTG